MWLFALFIGLPLIEIGLFVTVGGWIGLWPTLAIVLGTGVLGSWLIKNKGRQAMMGMRGPKDIMSNPMGAVAHGGLTMLAGVLLILPGFFTDMLGILLLLPPVRAGIVAVLASRVKVQGFGHGAARRDDVIDGEFIELDAEPQEPGPSGWTRH